MILIVSSPEQVVIGEIEVVTRTGPDGVSTCNGRIVGDATADEYHAQLDEIGFSRDRDPHGPYYYKVAVD